MSTERLHLPDRHALEVLRHHPAWEFLAGLFLMLRRTLGALRHQLPEPDTTIAWEDGESHHDGDARG
jgi:hypothetical protein